jgi:hypothetical protein
LIGTPSDRSDVVHGLLALDALRSLEGRSFALLREKMIAFESHDDERSALFTFYLLYREAARTSELIHPHS